MDVAVRAASMRARNRNGPDSLSMVYVSPTYVPLMSFKNVIGGVSSQNSYLAARWLDDRLGF